MQCITVGLSVFGWRFLFFSPTFFLYALHSFIYFFFLIIKMHYIHTFFFYKPLHSHLNATIIIFVIPDVVFKLKAKLHNHPLVFDSIVNRPPKVLILQYNYLRFLN